MVMSMIASMLPLAAGSSRAAAPRVHVLSRSRQVCRAKGPVVVIDNYDSFTYNICQVRPARSAALPQGAPASSCMAVGRMHAWS
jgi:hypothetical protein